MREKIPEYAEKVRQKTAQEIVSWAVLEFGVEHLALASSMGAEDQALTDILWVHEPQAHIFTLDTGRLPQETHELIQETNAKYGRPLKIVFPEKARVEEMVNLHGPNLFYESLAKRKMCCEVRKVEPLRRELKNYRAWMTGLRRSQAVTRQELPIVEWDETFGLVKINPLAAWSEKDVWDYLKEKGIPYNKLHDQGYPSIGCAPCTRAVAAGEDIRAGRWWWEQPEHKECGLHVKNAKPDANA